MVCLYAGGCIYAWRCEVQNLAEHSPRRLRLKFGAYITYLYVTSPGLGNRFVGDSDNEDLQQSFWAILKGELAAVLAGAEFACFDFQILKSK